MQDWHSTCLGRRTLPRDLSSFEIEAFFNFSDAERRVIEERRSAALKLALALQVGFLRMTGRLLEAVRIVPPVLWRHLGEQLGHIGHRCHPQILSGATAGAKEYSWCRPPSTAFARTAISSRRRCRDLELKL